MSKFSGRCDLYDHIYMIGCKGTDNNTSEQEKFEVFKRRTDGMLHQRIRFELDRFNIDTEIEIVNNESILSKKKVNKKWRYYYLGEEYKSLKALNKRGYYCTVDIGFKTMLDLVKYYGCIISSMVSTEDSEYIYIQTEPEVDEKRRHQWFRKNKMIRFYSEDALTEEYIRLVKKYY